MAKFRKKPLLVDAFRWTGDHDQENDPVWVVDAIKRGDVSFYREDNQSHMIIRAPVGVDVAAPGDWVVREEDGSICAYTRLEFEATHEEVAP